MLVGVAVLCVQIKGRKGMDVFDTDEGPRAGTTAESLGRLPTVFKKDGTVTAGTASGITDGAAAMVVASEEAVTANGLTPLARVVSWGMYVAPVYRTGGGCQHAAHTWWRCTCLGCCSAGVEPTIMGYACLAVATLA